MIRHWLRTWLALAVLALGFTAVSSAAQAQTFHNPTVRGYGVDICLNWAQNCGKPAADAFCRMQGYPESVANSVQWDTPPTLVLGDNRVCDQQMCDRFADIDCGSVAASSRNFHQPLIRGLGVDICLNWGTNCGKPAADAFCRMQGYRESSANSVRWDTPSTLVIGDNRICDQQLCDRFEDITCVGGGTVVMNSGQTFDNPTVRGYGVDICLNWGANCGKPAADAFCRTQGYTESRGHTVQWDTPPTLVLGDDRVCGDQMCDRFKVIDCIGR